MLGILHKNTPKHADFIDDFILKSGIFPNISIKSTEAECAEPKSGLHDAPQLKSSKNV